MRVKKRKNKQNKKAFTLVEILVVIAIVGVLAGVTWVSLNSTRKTSSAANACTQLASMINKTRNYVVSGRATAARIKIDGATATITGDVSGDNPPITQITDPTYIILGGVACNSTKATFAYNAPDGVDISNSGKITCSVPSGDTRTVTVTPYQAVCK